MPVSDPAPSPPATPLARAAELERLRGGLRIIAYRALGDPDAAEEAVQETLSRAVAALADGRFTDSAKLAAYVAGIARNVCSHIVRDRKHTVSLDAPDVPATQAGDPNLSTRFDPLEALISAAEKQRLRAAFSALSSADQELLRLCFGADRTPAEVAAALAQPAERVRKRKSRALERLRRAFLGAAERHDGEPTGTTHRTSIVSEDRRGEGNDE